MRLCVSVSINNRRLQPRHKKDRQASEPKRMLDEVIRRFPLPFWSQPILSMKDIDDSGPQKPSGVAEAHDEHRENQTEDEHERLVTGTAHPSVRMALQVEM